MSSSGHLEKDVSRGGAAAASASEAARSMGLVLADTTGHTLTHVLDLGWDPRFKTNGQLNERDGAPAGKYGT